MWSELQERVAQYDSRTSDNDCCTGHLWIARLARYITRVFAGDDFVRQDIRIKRVEILRAADATKREAAGGYQVAPAGRVEAVTEIRRGQQFPVD